MMNLCGVREAEEQKRTLKTVDMRRGKMRRRQDQTGDVYTAGMCDEKFNVAHF